MPSNAVVLVLVLVMTVECLCLAGVVAGSSLKPQGTQGTQVVLLGTGTPIPSLRYNQQSSAVVVNGTAYIVDAGAGTIGRCQEAFVKLGIPALEPWLVRHAFLTHLHSDHTLGLNDLILTPWVMHAEEPLKLFGPQGTASMADSMLAAYKVDITNRLRGNEPINPTAYKVHSQEITDAHTEKEGSVLYEDANVRVRTFRVDHVGLDAYGYRFETADRTIVFSGDTTPVEAIVRACDGCDVLVHEVYSMEMISSKPEEWQEYIRKAHTSSLELAELANRARPKLLLLSHHLVGGDDADPEVVLAEIRQHYSGDVRFGRDVEVY